jgi:Family of unknown function (DUF6220)
MTWTRSAFQWLVWLFLLGVAIQFFLAGLGVMGGESIEPHRAVGSLLQLVAIVLAILAFVSKQARPVLIMCVVLLVLTILQSVFAQEDLDPIVLRSFHVFDALLIAGLAMHLQLRAGSPFSRSA